MDDLLIVGGGPAGLVTAIEARLAGLAVTVLDRARPPIDKPCGEGLMPDAVARLAEIGVPLAGQGRPFRGIRYLDGGVVAEGYFPHQHGLGVRRLELHRRLAERAEEVGVACRWGVAATALSGAGVESDAGAFCARHVVGADGLLSRVRRWAGLETHAEPQGKRRRFGVRRHFEIGPWTDMVEVYWAAGCEAYVTPVGPREVGVALLWSGRKAGFDDLLGAFPALAERLAGARPLSPDRGCGPLRQRVRRVYSGKIALVGDASGYLDAITGEGLALAFHQARALIEAILRNDLAEYQQAHRRIGRLPNGMTALVLALERHPELRRRAIRALAAEPALFSRLLGIHSRDLPLRRLGFDGAWRLARRLALPTA